MKLTKMLGLAVVAAIAVMAFAGAGTASATTLCKVKENPCAAANQYPTHTTILALSTKAVLSGSLPVTCHSHVTILVLEKGVLNVAGDITLLDWTSCKGCSPVTTTLLPSGTFMAVGSGGTITTTSATKVELKNCLGLGITCKAEASNVSLKFNGGKVGSTANAKAENVPVSLSGGLCGTKGTWNAGGEGSEPYVVTEVNGSATGEIWASESP